MLCYQNSLQFVPYFLHTIKRENVYLIYVVVLITKRRYFKRKTFLNAERNLFDNKGPGIGIVVKTMPMAVRFGINPRIPRNLALLDTHHNFVVLFAW